MKMTIDPQVFQKPGIKDINSNTKMALERLYNHRKENS